MSSSHDVNDDATTAAATVADQPLISSESATKGTEAIRQRKCGSFQDTPAAAAAANPVVTKKRSVDAVVEAYLDEHPAFLDDYIRRKVGRKQIETWLFAGSTTSSSGKSKLHHEHPRRRLILSSDPNLIKTGGLLASCVRPLTDVGHAQDQQGRQRSRSFTPLRKLSATTFEAGGLATPILATTSDGQPSFLRTLSVAAASEKLSDSSTCSETNNARHISNRNEMLLTLLPDLMQRNNLPAFAKTLMKSANLLLGQAARVELVVLRAPNSWLNATVFLMEKDNVEAKYEQDPMQGNPVLAAILKSKHVINDGERRSLLGPLLKPESLELLGCLQLVDKEGGFTLAEERLLDKLLNFASVALNGLAMQIETKLELARSEVFLELARTVFREPTRLEATMLIILTNFLSLIDCARCQISLCDRRNREAFKRVFDLQRNDLLGHDHLDAPFEDRLSLKSQTTGKVALTGQKVNLGRDQLLKDGDNNNEFPMHSFLCLPISDPEGEVVGVISLANKESDGECQMFSHNDERFVEAFAVFCGMAIRNASDYEMATVSEAKLQVAFEVMNFQAASNADEATVLASLDVPAASSCQIDSLDFSYLSMDDMDTLKVLH